MLKDGSFSHLESFLQFKTSDSTTEEKKLCYLSDGLLTICDNEQVKPDFEIPLVSIDDVIDTSDGSTFSFTIRDKNHMIFSFTASDHIVVSKWLIALNVDTPSSMHVSFNDFQLLAIIGKGFSGEVILAKYIPTGKLVALKSIPKESLGSNNSLKHAFAERNILMLSATPFVTRLLSTFQTPESLFYVLEFVPGGDLAFHLSHGKYFSPNQVKIYLAEIAVALSYLHNLGIVFRDLKPANILVDANGHLKLTDFGLSKYLLFEDHTTSLCGTHEYLAPEMIKGSAYDYAVDWWSFGVVAYLLLEGILPFESQNLNRLYERIAKSPLKFWKPIPAESKSFIQGLLQKEPSKRLGCGTNGEAEIFDHPYFASIDWEKIKNKDYQMEFLPDVNGNVLKNFDCANTSPFDDNIEDPMFANISCDETHVNGFSYAGQGLESPTTPDTVNLLFY